MADWICRNCGLPWPRQEVVCPQDGGPLYSQETMSRLGMLLERYLVLDVLGEGGRGVVYSARHVALDKPVAIKILHEHIASMQDAADDFLREARATSRIRHPNIVDVTDFGTTPEGLLFLVMELLEGHSLEAALIREGLFDVFRTTTIMYQVCQALRSAHEQGIIHRDLKPANIFLTERTGRRRVVEIAGDGEQKSFSVQPEGRFDFVTVLDFGLARVIESRPDPEEEEQLAMIDGTPQYMAPEQIMGREGDERSDIYSLGVVFYRMVTGELPYSGRDITEIFHGHVYGRLLPPNLRNPRVPIDSHTISTIERCLAKDPADRFQSMTELLEVLPSCFTDRVYLRYADRLQGASQAGITPDHSPRPPPGLYVPRRATCPAVVKPAAFHEHAGLAGLLADAGQTLPDDPEHPVYLLGAHLDGALVGCIGWEDYERWAVLRSLVVLSEHREAGVGARLVGDLCLRLAKFGAREVFLSTADARAFFERLGFIAVDAAMLPAAVIASPTFVAGAERGETFMWHGLREMVE